MTNEFCYIYTAYLSIFSTNLHRHWRQYGQHGVNAHNFVYHSQQVTEWNNTAAVQQKEKKVSKLN